MQRVVLLGASNLTPSFRLVARRLTASKEPGPWHLLAAAGHGRAYAVWSHVGLRGLPPIAGCGLWRALAAQPAMPTRALVADPGNDLALGASTGATAEAVRRCLERLRATGAETVLTLPPVASLSRLPAWRFVLFRSILFPGRAFAQATILRRLRELSARLDELAAELGAEAVEPEPQWFGADGIHLRRSRRRRAWRSMLSRWPTAPAADPLPGAVRWSFLRAETARLPALRLGRPQPSRRLADGSTLALF